MLRFRLKNGRLHIRARWRSGVMASSTEGAFERPQAYLTSQCLYYFEQRNCRDRSALFRPVLSCLETARTAKTTAAHAVDLPAGHVAMQITRFHNGPYALAEQTAATSACRTKADV